MRQAWRSRGGSPAIRSLAPGHAARAIVGAAPAGPRTDVRPWLGKEAAFALLDTPGRPPVADRARRPQPCCGRARSWPAPGRRPTAAIDGVRAAARTLGHRARVRRPLPRCSARRRRCAPRSTRPAAAPASLAGDPAYQQRRRRRAGGPGARRVRLAAGVRRVLEPRGGAARRDRRAARPAGAAGRDDLGLGGRPAAPRVRIHSALDPALAGVSGPPAQFAPTLASRACRRGRRCCSTSTASTGRRRAVLARGRDRRGRRQRSRRCCPGSAPRSRPRASTSTRSSRSSPARRPSALGHRRAGACRRRSDRRAHAASGGDAERARAGSRRRSPRCSRRRAAGPGQAPGFGDSAGRRRHRARAGARRPGSSSTTPCSTGSWSSPRASARSTGRGRGTLARWPMTPATEPALANRPGQVSSLLFLDFSQLLSLGEQTGLTRGARVRGARPTCRRSAPSVSSSTSGESDTTAELLLQIP